MDSGEHPFSPLLASASNNSWSKTDVGLIVASDFGDVENGQNDNSSGGLVDKSVADAKVVGDERASVVDEVGIKSADVGMFRTCSLGACDNAEHNVPIPSRTHCGSAPIESHDVPEEPSHPCPVPKWTPLFSKLPKNAGVHSPRRFDKVEIEGVMIPPVEVIETGVDYW